LEEVVTICRESEGTGIHALKNPTGSLLWGTNQ